MTLALFLLALLSIAAGLLALGGWALVNFIGSSILAQAIGGKPSTRRRVFQIVLVLIALAIALILGARR